MIRSKVLVVPVPCNVMRKLVFAYTKNKGADQVASQLISAYVFAT